MERAMTSEKRHKYIKEKTDQMFKELEELVPGESMERQAERTWELINISAAIYFTIKHSYIGISTNEEISKAREAQVNDLVTKIEEKLKARAEIEKLIRNIGDPK